MANPSDHYDPTMFLGQTVSKYNAGVPETGAPDNARFPAALSRFDGTSNLRSAGVDKLPLQTFTTPPDNGLRLPQGADNFDPLNLPAPPRVHMKFPNHGTVGQP